jgi:hypothetical protein
MMTPRQVGSVTAYLTGHMDIVTAMCALRNCLWSASADNTIRRWSVKVRRTILGKSQNV